MEGALARTLGFSIADEGSEITAKPLLRINSHSLNMRKIFGWWDAVSAQKNPCSHNTLLWVDIAYVLVIIPHSCDGKQIYFRRELKKFLLTTTVTRTFLHQEKSKPHINIW